MIAAALAPSLSFRPAEAGDVPALAAMINAAYRGDGGRTGWTDETRLLGGRRIDQEGLRALLDGPESLILLGLQGADTVGSVHLRQLAPPYAYLGMLVVRPDCQGQGVGRRLMGEAELTVRRLWGAQRLQMTVISLREDLIAYYRRRGWRPTGERRPFPTDDALSVALVEGLGVAGENRLARLGVGGRIGPRDGCLCERALGGPPLPVHPQDAQDTGLAVGGHVRAADESIADQER